MSETDQSELSALEENISKKGNNSYYYAHGKKIEGPVWDGKEEPRLLTTATLPSSTKASIKSLDSFSWIDEKKSVKIYVDFENANEIEDEDINLELIDSNLEFKVIKDGKAHVLSVSPLHDAVESASFKKKSDKFIITLKKVTEASWYQLKKSS